MQLMYPAWQNENLLNLRAYEMYSQFRWHLLTGMPCNRRGDLMASLIARHSQHISRKRKRQAQLIRALCHEGHD